MTVSKPTSLDNEGARTLDFHEAETLKPEVWPQVNTDGLGKDVQQLDTEMRYAYRKRLGTGGMGEVVLCRDAHIGREVAVKRVLREHQNHANTMARFLREARVQGQLEHPAVVPVYDLSIDRDGAPFFSMKRVRGRSLEEILREPEEDSTNTRKLLTAFATVCLAVDFAHQRGVLHRDLKPGNVMLGDYGEVHVLDWGLAKISDEKDESIASEIDAQEIDAKTRNGSLLGTPGFMSPEQWQGLNSQLTSASDVYSLGVILFEILFREPLFVQRNLMAMMHDAVNGEYQPFSERKRFVTVSSHMLETLNGALALNPSERTQSARVLAEAIEVELDLDQQRVQRKNLAEVHLTHARKARAALSENDANAYQRAVKEYGRALVLDPERQSARDELAALLLEPPDVPPLEASLELQGWHERARAPLAGTTFFRLLLWFGGLLLAASIPIVPWSAAAVPAAMIAATAVFAGLTWIRKWTGSLPRFGLVVANTLALLSLASVFGPFLVVPALAATHLMIFIPAVRRRNRRWVIATTLLVVLAPWLGGTLGWLDGPELRFALADGALRVSSSVPLGTGWWLLLISTTVLGMIVPAMLVSRSQDHVERAERRVFLQGWYLRAASGTD